MSPEVGGHSHPKMTGLSVVPFRGYKNLGVFGLKKYTAAAFVVIETKTYEYL